MNAVADITISTRVEWVKAHIGIEGNEEADKAAKEGADTLEPEHPVDTPWTIKKAKIQKHFYQIWKDKWNSIEGTNIRSYSYIILTPTKHEAYSDYQEDALQL